ncbi:hypothetical protein HUE87_01820 [Candidatus Sulfurimonas marisnigri]|uniref:Type II secretion system protein n=1 Tax=Candidatus Sulfurimonas marisnigri TaxID=2740405 RepID=A0A7S7M0Q3_9BACT|nr:hypothetical protein [Candidatus Sulfurimonas marisnigri]QOY55007.1 hypothetical protein HUE87_01820 [Candidatus Sulfurimonas marisnigri]
MQRKNYILKNRSGFAMIMAMAVIVIIATIMALSLAMTAETGKRTTDLYLYEQSVLYSKSAAELALLTIAQNGSCTTIPSYTLGSIYDINISVRYVYRGLACGGTGDYFTTLTTDEQNGSVLMDITVTTTEGTEPIRYFRRSIQKL